MMLVNVHWFEISFSQIQNIWDTILRNLIAGHQYFRRMLVTAFQTTRSHRPEEFHLYHTGVHISISAHSL